jgi:hypothetical protein
LSQVVKGLLRPALRQGPSGPASKLEFSLKTNAPDSPLVDAYTSYALAGLAVGF